MKKKAQRQKLLEDLALRLYEIDNI